MKPEDKAKVQQALEAAYLAGFQATGEGYNAEYPFEGRNPEDDAAWVRDRDDALHQLLEQPEQEHYHALEQALTRLQKRYSELEAKVGAQPEPVQGPYSAPIKHLWDAAPKPAEPDYKRLYEQLCEQYDVLVNELKAAQPAAWVGLEKADMPDGDNPMYDHDYFIKGMIWADVKLREKNGGAV